MAKKKKKDYGFIYVILAILIVIIIVLIGIVTLCMSAFAPSKKQVDVRTYLQSLFESYDNEAYGTIIEGTTYCSEIHAYFANGQAYLPLDYAKSLNKRIYLDEEHQTIRYSMPTRTLVIPLNSYEYDNGIETVTSNYPLFISIEETKEFYIAASFVANHTDLSYETFANPNRIWIKTASMQSELTTVHVTTEGETGAIMRTHASKKSDIIKYVQSDEQLLVICQNNGFTELLDSEGIVGFIRTQELSEPEPLTDIGSHYEAVEYSSKHLDNVCMAWHQTLGGDTGLEKLPEIIEASDGVLNVIAPTFFLVADTDGNIDTTAATKEYVDLAHTNGLLVFAMIDNINIPIDSLALLKSTDARANLIAQLMEQASLLGLDGINVDFEALSSECGPHYLQFLRELSIACRTNDLFLSVDNYVPMEYTKFYDRTEQGIIVDYVVMMGYDEHYSGSESGSTASITFVQKGIEQTLAEVPKEKLICGIPFYTRIWNTADGSSVAASMKTCAELASKYETVWKEEEQQNYLTYTESGVLYEVWLEDLDSQKARLSMIKGYELGGIACWKAGLETKDVWALLQSEHEKGL